LQGVDARGEGRDQAQVRLLVPVAHVIGRDAVGVDGVQLGAALAGALIPAGAAAFKDHDGFGGQRGAVDEEAVGAAVAAAGATGRGQLDGLPLEIRSVRGQAAQEREADGLDQVFQGHGESFGWCV